MYKNYRAFTLIELIIYIGLSAYLLSGILISVYLFSEETSRGTAQIYLEYEGDFIENVFANYVQNSDPNSLFSIGTSSQTLVNTGPQSVIGSSNGSFFEESPDGATVYSSNLVRTIATQFSLSTSSNSSSTNISLTVTLAASTTQGSIETQSFSETVVFP